MSKESKVAQFKQAIEAFRSQKPEEFNVLRTTFADFEGADVADTRTSLRFVLDVLEKLEQADGGVRKLVETRRE